jgi:T-complex protein 1 subunit gamma
VPSVLLSFRTATTGPSLSSSLDTGRYWHWNRSLLTCAQDEGGLKTVNIKRYARVEMVPGGESRVLGGVMLNKDITHPKKRRFGLSFGSQTNMEFSKESDWERAQSIEEGQVKLLVSKILEFKSDLVITEKGVSGTAFPSFPMIML